jgi:hypothetical protein
MLECPRWGSDRVPRTLPAGPQKQAKFDEEAAASRDILKACITHFAIFVTVRMASDQDRGSKSHADVVIQGEQGRPVLHIGSQRRETGTKNEILSAVRVVLIPVLSYG